MSINIRDYVSDDHVESIGEIARNQSSIIQALSIDNSNLKTVIKEQNKELDKFRPFKNAYEMKKEISRLKNKLIEVRKYLINSNYDSELPKVMEMLNLDKENK